MKDTFLHMAGIYIYTGCHVSIMMYVLRYLLLLWFLCSFMTSRLQSALLPPLRLRKASFCRSNCVLIQGTVFVKYVQVKSIEYIYTEEGKKSSY